jgi:AAA+ superfamily predicted ATPase
MQTTFDEIIRNRMPPLLGLKQGLWLALQRLDQRLENAVKVSQELFGLEACADPFRGLHISLEEIIVLLSQSAGEPRFLSEDSTKTNNGESDYLLLKWLADTFGLSEFDTDIVLIALAPEIDPRYGRIYAYLQDNVSRRRPSVDLVLNLLCASQEDKLARQVHFSPDAPLLRNGLIQLLPDTDQLQPPLLAHYIKLDDQVVRLLLGSESTDPRLASFCHITQPTDISRSTFSDDCQVDALIAGIIAAQESDQSVRLYFYGPRGSGKRQTTEDIATKLNMPVLVADLARAVAPSRDWALIFRLVFREAWFRGALLYLDGLDAFQSSEQALTFRQLLEVLVRDPGITIMAGTRPWTAPGNLALGVVTVPFGIPSAEKRRAIWQGCLKEMSLTCDADAITALADRFCLTQGQICEATATVHNQAFWRNGGKATDLIVSELYAAARAQSSQHLAALAYKVEPKYDWKNIVLPADTIAQLKEMCQRVTYRQRVMDEWGFDEKLSLGKGVNALFAGPSGTGKTMAAEIIARELELDLYKIDLSGVVSKYIGETEKNLDRIFSAAENANAILLFDEADALFGRRSEVRDSHDRYANIEISYLLQKMEQYKGIAILATNLRQNLDEAFIRRLAFTIHFPFPDETSRQQIWSGIWPEMTPLANNVNMDYLARQFKLSGGNIKNIALAASFLAAADGNLVTMEHLFQAIRREYQKMGKSLSNEELYGATYQATGNIQRG